MTVEPEPTAKQALAQSLQLEAEDDRYAMLFHADLEPLHLGHRAPHRRARRTSAAWPTSSCRRAGRSARTGTPRSLLTLAASRMIAMELDLDLAGAIARSARDVAELDKPLARIAESASLSIIGGLDETSVRGPDGVGGRGAGRVRWSS